MQPISKFILSGSIAATLLLPLVPANAAFTFLGVAAGDASDTGATVWSRGVDATTPAATSVDVQVTTDPTFASYSTISGTTVAANDYTVKFDIGSLTSATVYYYRFFEPISTAQAAAGIEPFGLQGYPGLHDLQRLGDATASTSPQAVDFYSPDTFNFTVFDVTADGKTLTVSSVGLNATAQNTGTEYGAGPQAGTVFSFQIDATPLTRGGYILGRRLNKMVQQVTLTNNTGANIVGPINLALDSLSANTTLANANGVTTVNAPLGSPYITLQAGDLAPGASVSSTLQFTKPAPGSGNITYTARTITGTANP